MNSTAPIAIGTRGTVGALVRKEIEYFSKLQLDRHGSSRKPRGSVHVHQAAWPSLRFLVTPWKRKKHRSCTRSFLPSMCSVAEVVERNQLSGIPGFSYRVLSNDMNSNLDV
ncbi:hypothetical protein L484_012872 [Morus notabilis]|uniref:Uncharacterized protein n=1 Tax=Morus notabilis TaxID=981085 RepID=W9RFM0_9ROSA|nr:uncharacterized protein LOC21396065 [Morus notabilis]EXB88433.1 hypothetical protein L484_012872 [Morus notabilis]